MTDDTFELTRRKILASAGAVGLAGAGAGLGTSAFFSDQETFTNNSLVAGELDMRVGYSEHYSDWSDDEDGSDTATTDDDVSVRMWSGAPGTTGSEGDLTGDEAGLPIDDAWLIAVDNPDQFLENTLQEQFPDKQTRKELDQGDADPCEVFADIPDDRARPLVELKDVKPGDFGEVTFDLALCDNPGYIWLQAGNVTASENDVTEPEADDEDEDQKEDGSLKEPPEHGHGVEAEILDVVQAAYWVDDGDNYQDGDEAPKPEAIGDLREILESLTGIGVQLEGDIDAEDGGGTGDTCFSAGQHSIAFAWWVPVDHGNEIQSDSVSFDLGFYTEQCRHNDGTGDQLTAFLTDDAPLNDEPWDGSVVDTTDGDATIINKDGDEVSIIENGTVVIRSNALTSVDFPELPPQLPFAFNPQAVRISQGTPVKWRWVRYDSDESPPFPPSGSLLFNIIPHNVVSLDVDGSGDPLFSSGNPVPAGPSGDPVVEYSLSPGDPEYVFDEPGLYLYYCEPHGSPHFHPASPGTPFDEVINETGMRGAIIVE